MFTGIVEEVGRVERIRAGAKSAILTLQGKLIFSDLKIGDSVAVNGVCLTARTIEGSTFTADVMHETLDRSSLGDLRPGSPVNLERAMAADGRFGGHMVSGHIDGMGRVHDIQQDDNAIWYTIAADPMLTKYIIPKGSVAIDGISLTVVDVAQEHFRVSIIPHTAKETILSHKNVGDKVNLENDLIGKYVEKLLSYRQPENSKSSITKEFLLQNGY